MDSDHASGGRSLPQISEADYCRMASPEEIDWPAVSTRTLLELVAVDQVPACDGSQLVGPAYWDFALGELGNREPEAARRVAEAWVQEHRGDYLSRVGALRMLLAHDKGHALSLVRERLGSLERELVRMLVEDLETEFRTAGPFTRHTDEEQAAFAREYAWLFAALGGVDR